MRLYIQLKPNEETQKLCLEWQKLVCNPLERRYRLDIVETKQLHLTIAEIRKIDADKIKEIEDILRQQQTIIATTKCIKVDWFPSRDKPSVIAAIIHLDDELASIYKNVRAIIKDLNVEIIERPIRAHITLARAHQKSISPESDLPYIPLDNECGFLGLHVFSA